MRSPLAMTGIGVFALCGAFVAGPVASAHAEPARQLTLTVEVTGTPLQSMTLDCGSGRAAGGHPNATKACQQLDAVDGDFDALPESSGACTLEMRPVTAAARGTWGGKAVTWQKKFDSPCQLVRKTGDVFRF